MRNIKTVRRGLVSEAHGTCALLATTMQMPCCCTNPGRSTRCPYASCAHTALRLDQARRCHGLADDKVVASAYQLGLAHWVALRLLQMRGRQLDVVEGFRPQRGALHPQVYVIANLFHCDGRADETRGSHGRRCPQRQHGHSR